MKLTPISAAVAEAIAEAPRGFTVPTALNYGGFKQLLAGSPQEAYRLLRAAVRENPKDKYAWDNLARTLKALHREDEAIAIYRRLMSEHPDWLVAPSNLAMSLLRRGEFEEGWRLKRHRFSVVPGSKVIEEPLSGKPLVDFQTPTVEQLRGQHILIVSEQGFGDEIFYMRWVPMLRARAQPATVWWWPSEKRGEDVYYPKLLPIFSRVPNTIVPANECMLQELRSYNAVPVALGDLPMILGMKHISEAPPSLTLPFSPPNIERETRRRIGVTWSAGQKALEFKGGLFKAVPPRELGRALAGLDAEIVVLQRALDYWQLADLECGLGRVVDDVCHGDGLRADSEMDWLAGVLSSFDDYVCVSNTNIHIIAAMTLPKPRVHVMVQAMPEFRWARLGADERSPWFPDFHAYRADVHGWHGALDKLAAALRSDV